MSTKSRRRYTPDFKTRVAMEVIRGVKTVREIAAEYGVPPVQVTQWKRAAREGLVGVFEKPRRRDEQAVGKRTRSAGTEDRAIDRGDGVLKKPPLDCGLSVRRQRALLNVSRSIFRRKRVNTVPDWRPFFR